MKLSTLNWPPQIDSKLVGLFVSTSLFQASKKVNIFITVRMKTYFIIVFLTPTYYGHQSNLQNIVPIHIFGVICYNCTFSSTLRSTLLFVWTVDSIVTFFLSFQIIARTFDWRKATVSPVSSFFFYQQLRNVFFMHFYSSINVRSFSSGMMCDTTT